MFSQLGYYICIPFAWVTRLFYSLTGSYGLALILFTLIVKLVLLPFQLKSKKSMLRMNRLQGKVKDIQTRYANNKQRQQEEMADLYAREGINPTSGCLWSFLPLPILIALYSIIRLPLRYFMSLSTDTIEQIKTLATSLGYQSVDSRVAYEQIYLAKFIHENWNSFSGKFPGLVNLDYNFLGLDLADTARNVTSQFPGGGWPVWGLLLLPIVAALAQLLMSVVTMKGSGSADNSSSKTMMYMMPLLTIWMGYSFPAALMIYWIANAVFSALQELLLNKKFNAILDREETDKEREKREKRYAKYEQQKAMLQQQQQRSQPQGSRKKQAQRKEQQRKGPVTTEAGKIGGRPYARGRSFSEDHYKE